jgi:DNA-binding transcriptional LysR family regulator
LSEQGSATRRIVEEQLGKVGVKPEVVMELGNIEAVKKAVEAGLGISIMSRSAALGEVEAGRLRFLRVLELNLQRDVNLVYHKDKHFSSALSAFWAFLAEHHGM